MSIRIALAAITVAFVAACQPQQPEVVTQPVVVAPEPVFSGKY
ncbi:hypothetical protein [Paracoccus sp. S-4012]|nr:hypothetical protein [Paracoccus sp. S-4012]